MKKLLITLGMVLFTSLQSFAPNLDKDRIEHVEKLEKVVNISKELDINNIGLSNIPLYPFIELDTTVNFRLTSKFGYRLHPILKVVLLHKGIDIVVDKFEPIMASGSGQVIRVEYSNIGYGNNIIIQHNDELSTLYAHLSEIRVKEGNIVQAGDVIALSGQTGLVWGKNQHLHFELRQSGKPIDPLKYIGVKTSNEFAIKMYKLKEINDYLFGVS